jgi:hypothetical protein
LGEAVDTLTVFAEKDNYNNQFLPFVVEVFEKQTDLILFLNGENKTEDAFIELPIGTELNISARFIDIDGNIIDDGKVELFSNTIETNLTYSENNSQYTVILDTKSDLVLGVNILTITAQGTNFETQNLNIRVTVRRRQTGITPGFEEEESSIRPGESFTIRVSLKDLDFNQTLANVSFTYRWRFGEGELTDQDGDGVYTHTLTNVPEGTHTVTVTAFAGDDYELDTLEITLVSSRPPEEFFLIQTVAIVGIVSALGITGYLYAYQKILRYPKPVRRVKKFKKTLTKDKKPDISVKDRKNAFNEAYQKDLEESTKGTSRMSKIKPKLSGKIKKENVAEEAVEEASKKGTETKE